MSADDTEGTEPEATEPEATEPETTEPETTAVPGLAVPDSQRRDLEDAGLGWMLDVGYPDQPAGVPWPTTAWPTGPLPAGVDPAVVQGIVEEAFRPGGADAGTVDALLAVSGGQLVLEAYNGWDPAAPHMSWSMAKSVTHALMGLLVAEGRIDPFAPAPVPEWSDPADPRHAITVDELLRMRSGLDWQEEYAGASDVITMLYGDGRADRGHYAAAKSLLVEPDTAFSYSTGTSMILARIIADQVGYGEAGTAWAQAALFDPLGITTVVHDLDGVGVMSGGSNINMSAQDFARFGMLYLRGGQWDGRQVVSQAWVDDARTPLPDAPEYGAHWWVDADDGRNVHAFRADGYAGQVIIVVPSLDLVVVALADVQDGRSDLAANALVEAFAAGADPVAVAL
jgi:CubicO group peptidase (beta-lactamase class C family)